jgi:hypothetical protein
MAWNMRSLCSGKVPLLLSCSPWINSMASLILSALLNGDMAWYTSCACQNCRSSDWKPNGVSVRL